MEPIERGPMADGLRPLRIAIVKHAHTPSGGAEDFLLAYLEPRVAACAMLARNTQARLADFLQSGGHIIWADGDLPNYDEGLNPYTLFSQAARESGQVRQIPDLDTDWPALIIVWSPT